MPQNRIPVDYYEVTLDDGTKDTIPIGKDVPEDRIPAVIEGAVRARNRINKGFASQPNIGKPPNPDAPDARTPGELALDSMTNVGMGGPRALAALPGAAGELFRNLTGGLPGHIQLMNDLPGMVGGAVSSAVGQVKPVAQFLGQHMQQTMGPTPTNLVAGGPQPIEPPPPDSPEWKQAQEANGAMLEGALVGAGAGKGLSSLKARIAARAPTVATEVTAMENKLAPTGKGARLMARDSAPELAKDPDLVRAHGPAFDKELVRKYEAAGDAVKSIEETIPDTAPVDMSKSLKGFDELIKEYTSSASDEASRALNNWKDRIMRDVTPTAGDLVAKKPPTLQWDQFIEIKRTFGNFLRNNGVWKRIAADTATEKDLALSRAYGQLMQASDEASKAAGVDLTSANRRFRLMNDAIHAADIETETGRRIKQIGTPVESMLKKRAKQAVKIGAPLAIGATGAKVIREIVNP